MCLELQVCFWDRLLGFRVINRCIYVYTYNTMCMYVCTAVSAGSAFSPPIRGPPWRYLPVFRCAFWPLSYIPLLLRIVLCTRYKSVVAHYVTYSINIQCMHLVLGIGITFPSDKPIFFLFAGLFVVFVAWSVVSRRGACRVPTGSRVFRRLPVLKTPPN